MSIKSNNKWSDKQLLESIQVKDDRGAFEIIYQRYWSKLYLSAFSILKDQGATEDIIQEIFIQLWVKRKTNHIDSLKAYLFTAIRFQVFKTIRNSKVRQDLINQIEQITFAESPDELLPEKEINALLEVAIQQLPDRCREIFILSRKEFLSVKEIAARLEISPKTVENQITIAIKKLRVSMREVLFWWLVSLPFIWHI